ncbi:hypothetical protein [Thioalkalivibrio sp. AKL6]|uniref:hypothetical protein n=1 Tax=Thioalkalivibrio sp. AKL6 TaxID=1158154 RepID=UPI0003A48755|nr:hypothetical protein [Thioalkalivibrio sp. AKL6]
MYFRIQLLEGVRSFRPVYQRYRGFLYPLARLAVKIPSIKKLRDVAINGDQAECLLHEQDIENGLQGQDVHEAVPRLIGKTPPRHQAATFEYVVLFYREAVQYDDLKIAAEYFSDWLDKNYHRLPGRHFIHYLEVLAFSLRSLNGRVHGPLPVVNFNHIRSEAQHCRAYLTYISALADNLEFARVERLFDSPPGGIDTLFRAVNGLGKKPVRVELDVSPRLNAQHYGLAALKARLLDLGLERSFVGMIEATVLSDSEKLIAAVNEELNLRPVDNYLGQNRLRVSTLFPPVLDRLIVIGRTDVGRELLERVRPSLREWAIENLETRLAVHGLDKERATRYLQRKSTRSAVARKELISHRWSGGDFTGARELVEEAASRNSPIRKRVADQHAINQLRFLEETSFFLKRVSQPAQPSGYVLMASLGCLNTLAMVTPALLELKRRGFVTGSLMKGILDQDPPSTAHRKIKSLFNCIESRKEDGDVVLDWEIDWDNCVVAAEGVNVYQGIYESLSVTYRRASISIDEEPFASTFDKILRQCDFMIRVCKRIESAAESVTEPVVLLGSNAHIAPFSVFRDFVLRRCHPNLRFVVANVAYENYYSNLGSKESGSMAVVDMSLYPTCRAPFLALPQRFEKWYEENRDSAEVAERFSELVRKNRNGRTGEIAAAPIITRLEEARREGRRIACCFGKILCDLAVPYDGGPAHRDMRDWLHHSVEVARENPDLLLLIKPHPHELRPEIALELTEKLEDIVPEDIPENVVFLDHSQFNTIDLVPYLDLAALWNGTACLELTGLGVPVVMCSHFGRHDYPVRLNYPKDRDDYECRLATAEFREPGVDLRKKAMALLHYMGTHDVAIPNRYARRPVSNDGIGAPVWYTDRMEEFLRSGDPHMSLAADRIIEGVEGTDGSV